MPSRLRGVEEAAGLKCRRHHLRRDRRLQLDRADAHRGAGGLAGGGRRRHGAGLSRSPDVDLLHLRSRALARRDRRRQGQCRCPQTCDRYVLARALRPPFAVEMGAGAGFATAPMPGAYVKNVAVPDTLSQVLDVGRAILDARARRQDVISRLIDADRREAAVHRQGDGRQARIARRLRGRRSRSRASTRARRRASRSRTRISCCWSTGAGAIVPDLIMNLHSTPASRSPPRCCAMASRSPPSACPRMT